MPVRQTAPGRLVCLKIRQRQAVYPVREQVQLVRHPRPAQRLLEQDGETAGYGLLSLKYSHEAGGLELWVEELYVRPAFRGHGLGHEFFAWLRGLSAAEHIRRIRLETEPENERAAALYARMGFSPLGYCQMFREEAT